MGDGILWFTGQAGWYGRVTPPLARSRSGLRPAEPGRTGSRPRPTGHLLRSLAGSYLGAVDTDSGAVTVLEPPTAGAGVRRAWSDSSGRIWIAEWNAGRVGVYDPADGPGASGAAGGRAAGHAVYRR